MSVFVFRQAIKILPYGVGIPVMDVSVLKTVTEPMDATVSKGDTCQQASVSEQTEVNPEALSHTLHQTTASRQSGENDEFVLPKRKRGKEKLSTGAPVTAKPHSPTPMEVATQSLSQQPLFKQPTMVNPNFVFLWNARGTPKNKKSPKDIPTQNIVEIDKVPIYVQQDTEAEAAANNVVGWDSVLADVALLNPLAAERRIAVFWASWKRQQLLTWKANAKRHQDLKSGANPGGSPKTADTSAVPQTSQSTPPPSTTINGGGGEKRKCGNTPLSSEPVGKSKCHYATKQCKLSSTNNYMYKMCSVS